MNSGDHTPGPEIRGLISAARKGRSVDTVPLRQLFAPLLNQRCVLREQTTRHDVERLHPKLERRVLELDGYLQALDMLDAGRVPAAEAALKRAFAIRTSSGEDR